jgi:hypothetical protein
LAEQALSLGPVNVSEFLTGNEAAQAGRSGRELVTLSDHTLLMGLEAHVVLLVLSS